MRKQQERKVDPKRESRPAPARTKTPSEPGARPTPTGGMSLSSDPASLLLLSGMAAAKEKHPFESVDLGSAAKVLMAAATHPVDYAKTLIQIGHEPVPPRQAKTMLGRPALALPSVFR